VNPESVLPKKQPAGATNNNPNSYHQNPAPDARMSMNLTVDSEDVASTHGAFNDKRIMNRRSIADFGNYNTMPRGWGGSSTGYYKPIKADELKSFMGQ
jgi:hypothetical protein